MLSPCTNPSVPRFVFHPPSVTLPGPAAAGGRRGMGVCPALQHEVPPQGTQDGPGAKTQMAPQDGRRVSHRSLLLPDRCQQGQEVMSSVMYESEIYRDDA